MSDIYQQKNSRISGVYRVVISLIFVYLLSQ
jgi:hypothetical protein